MKIIKVSSQEESFCSTDVKSVSKFLIDNLHQTLKAKNEEKIIIEIFDIANEKQSLSSEFFRDKEKLTA